MAACGSAPLSTANSQTGRDAGPKASVDAGGVRADAGVKLSADAGAASDAGALEVTVLDQGVIEYNKEPVQWRALRLVWPGHAPTYAHWFPPATDGGTRPAVMLTMPYAGINFTGEEVDRRWAAQGDGAWPDVDGPNAGSAPPLIRYGAYTLDQAVAEAWVWHVHNFGVLFAYGRFYAGGDIENDRDDMVAAMKFLATSASVDREHIGVMGGSWGGFEALYGGAYAPLGVKPAAIVATAALSDFADEYAFITIELPSRYTTIDAREASRRFFEPYLRRMVHSGGAPRDFSGFTGADVASRLTSPTFLIHEDWDTLVNPRQSEFLANAAPRYVELMSVQHASPPPSWDAEDVANSHGPLLASYALSGALPLTSVFILKRLVAPSDGIIVPFDKPSFHQTLELFHARELEGVEPRVLAERLFEMTDPRVRAYNLPTGVVSSGAEVVADELNLVWGTSYTAQTVRAALDGGFP